MEEKVDEEKTHSDDSSHCVQRTCADDDTLSHRETMTTVQRTCADEDTLSHRETMTTVQRTCPDDALREGAAEWECADEDTLSHRETMTTVPRTCADDALREGAAEWECPDDDTLSHRETMTIVQSMLKNTLSTDPLLCDLPAEVTLEEVTSTIAVEYGQAMTVYIERADKTVMAVVVEQNCTVEELKHAVQRHTTLQEGRRRGLNSISWRYIWKRYWLYFEGQKLSNDREKLKEYGICNRATLTFMNRLKQRT